MTERGRTVAGLAAVVLLALLVHGRCIGNGWAFDDHRFIVRNGAIASLADPGRFFTDPSTADPSQFADIYRPLRTINYAVDRALFGLEPLGYHVESLLLHALNAALVFLLLLRLAGSVPGAVLGAGLFAAHPAQVESVAWVSSRADLLAALFTLGGLLAWLRCRGWDRWYLATLGLGALAVLSKEAAVVFPGFLVVLDGIRPDGGGARFALGRWRLHLPFVVLGAVFAFTVKHMLEESRGLPVGHLLGWWGGSWWANLGVAGAAAAYQVLFTLFPFRPSIDWYMARPASPLEPAPLLGLLLAGGLAAGAVAAVLRGGPLRRAAGGGVLIALLGGFLTSHLLFPVGIPTAERFLYFPLAGVGLAAAALHARLAPGGVRRAAAPVAVAVAALGAIAFARGSVWRDGPTLWKEGSAGAFSPRAVQYRLAWRNNGLALRIAEGREMKDRGEEERARALLQETREGFREILVELVDLNHFWRRTIDFPLQYRFEARVHRNLAAVALVLDEPEEALREAGQAAVVDPEDPRAPDLQSRALRRLGRLREAGRKVEEALDLAREWKGDEGDDPVRPEEAAALLNEVAEDRAARGLTAAALRALEASARLVPDPARNAAAERARDLRERIEARRREVEAAVARNPGDPGTLAARVAFEGLVAGDRDAARRLFHEAFGAMPEAPFARTLWALATVESDDTEAGWKAARAQHEATLARHPGDPGALLGLARCAEGLGEREEAARRYGEILALPDLAPDVRAEAEAGRERSR